ncbi:hypothetical protein LAV92_27870 [Bacillus cereus]|uniref:hypothetical protein n=1 Tax=Bacillus cereus TaxID=1396 RepID=UPI0023E36775|nr:hypothetical protein [Bacillus cereus]MDF3555488.1 hypothetical protein [Bacillus cereus]
MTKDNKTTEITVAESKQPRNWQPLPPLYFVAMDDWLDKLGENSFCLYLKLWTMVDRTLEQHCITTNNTKLVKKLNMSKSKYLRLIKPLYEYGLVDLVEYEDSKNKGSKPINIIVHKYPQNEFNRATMELEKCRDWEQRIDENYNYAKKGGRPKKQDVPEVVEADLPKGMQDLPKEEPKEEPKPVKKVKEVAFNENVNPVVISEFEYFKERMTVNKVDLNVVIKWVNKNVDTVPYNQMCFVFKQLATYTEDIHKTGAFISTTMKLVPTVYYPITSPVEPITEEPAFQPQVKLYNFLEEKGDKPVFNNDDLPF